MKSFCIKICPLLLVFIFGCTIVKAQPNDSAPKLIVNIVIDQMRQDYLFRFWDLYGQGGFKKLVNEGYDFSNCQYEYYPTYTAAGHANIGTGALPSVNGIVANDWYENKDGDKMYCVTDLGVKGVGTESSAGQMSPKNLKASTFGDELRLATNFQSKVFGVSLKDRGAILCSGHLSNAAYWLDLAAGNFVTSTYYMQQLPDWVTQFNQIRLVDTYLKQTWNPSVPMDILRKYTDEDNSPFENIFKGKTSPTFPYHLDSLKDLNNGDELIATTPFGNSLLLTFAEELIQNEKLGKNATGKTDVLYVSLSSTDYIGHFFGIRSMEIADTYIRLDKDLERFFSDLDKLVGEGQYVITLTADHGAADNPNFLDSLKYKAALFDNNIVKVDLRDFLEKKYGVDVIDGYKNLQVYLNQDVINANHIHKQEVIQSCLDFLKFQPGVQKVFDAQILNNGSLTDNMLQMYMHGYYPARCGDVYIMLQPGWLDMSWSNFGTTHGSTYRYDTHVPLLFYGKNIPHGYTPQIVHPSQIAATLSALLGIQMPNGCVAEPLLEYFK